MAQIWVPGPAPIFVQWEGETPLFLGHSEGPVSIQTRPIYKDVHCDIAGRAPLDKLWVGETGMVTANLVRFRENVATRLLSRAATAALPATLASRGTDPPGRVGTLLATELACPYLFVLFPYAAKPAFSNGANGPMPRGYRFWNAALDPDSFEAGASSELKHHFVWSCFPWVDMASGANVFGQGELTLYDHDMTAVTGLALT